MKPLLPITRKGRGQGGQSPRWAEHAVTTSASCSHAWRGRSQSRLLGHKTLLPAQVGAAASPNARSRDPTTTAELAPPWHNPRDKFVSRRSWTQVAGRGAALPSTPLVPNRAGHRLAQLLPSQLKPGSLSQDWGHKFRGSSQTDTGSAQPTPA